MKNNKIKINRYIEKLKPYKITSQDPWLFNKKDHIEKLDWNEGNYIPDFLKKEISHILKKNYIFNWYSDYTSYDLHKSLAKYIGISINNILSFPGSDSALETICRCFIEPEDNVLIPTPTYENFTVFAESCGAKVINHELKSPYIFDINNIRDKIKEIKPKVVYLSSPNNPCGYIISPDNISKMCGEFQNVLFICDHAYIEFCLDFDCTKLTQIHNNLIIVRTFSKALSLAGIRLGYVISNNVNLQTLSKIRNGKNISMLSQLIGTSVINNIDKYNKWIEEIIKNRQMTFNELTSMGIRTYNSYGNFLLFEIKGATYFLGKIKKEQIYIRDKIISTNGGIRVTISSKSACNKFLRSVKDFIEDEENKFYF
tara:strand:+ start:192 stop:1301 length:1110 start_codon:yes stop_codon:yes gene_type:complete